MDKEKLLEVKSKMFLELHNAAISINSALENIKLANESFLTIVDDDEILGDSELCITETNVYSVKSNEGVLWQVTNNLQGLECYKDDDNKFYIKCKFDTKLINQTEIIKCLLPNGEECFKEIRIIGLI